MPCRSNQCQALRRTRVKWANKQADTPHIVQTLDHIHWYAKQYSNAQGQALLS